MSIPVNDGSRTRIRRHPERAVPEQAEEFLREGRIAHVAYVVDGQPRVLPFLYFYEHGAVYLHGVPGSATIRALRNGAPVCVGVTLLDGLVASRGAKSHSANYRSVVVYGRSAVVADLDEKRAVFERMTERFFSGREAGHDYEHASVKDLRGVELLAVRIEEMSAKARTGPARGAHDSEDEYKGYSTFVLGTPETHAQVGEQSGREALLAGDTRGPVSAQRGRCPNKVEARQCPITARDDDSSGGFIGWAMRTAIRLSHGQ
jgi:nitroimidazol reductase NimA-like FMN-containing flavoprotein (pyridoxamine 5'-phosphate oxidase superfamily)